jgi:N-acetylneuraminic acid mutarotase
MKTFYLLFLLTAIYSVNLYSQSVPDLPIAISYASAEVWGDSIYFFGGSNDYNGTELYKRIYKYNGVSWSYYDTIPFNHVWGIESAIKGDTVFLYGGWSGGGQKLYSYRLSTKTWTQLAQGPSTFANYGHTLEFYNGILYAFYNGYAASYNLSLNSWTNLNTISFSASFLASTVYNDEIYLAGWSNSSFFKFNPTTNKWTQLSSLPEYLSGGTLRTIGSNIYLVGGSSGFSGGTSWNIYRYDPLTNQWTLSSQFSSKRAYMEDVIYQNKFYILGGVNEATAAVNLVEYIMDQTTDVETNSEVPNEFLLAQNYPNPFNPSTKIRYSIPSITFSSSSRAESREVGLVTLKVYDILGNEVATLVNEEKPSGIYEVDFNASALSSGIYFYKLNASAFSETKKMTIIK